MADEPKDEPKELDPFGRPIDHFGIGMNADATLNVVPPDQLAARIAERNAWDKASLEDIKDVLKGGAMSPEELGARLLKHGAGANVPKDEDDEPDVSDLSDRDKEAVLAIPDFQTLMLPVLRSAAAGEVRISDVVEKLADEFDLSAEERSHLLPSGKQTTFANRVHWAKSYLGKAGLVELTKRAHFRITDRGREVLAAPPERIDIKFLSRFPSFQKFREVSSDAENGEVAPSRAAEISPTLTPDEVMRDAHRELNEALADELMQRIRSGTPAFFESLVVRLFVAMGYGGSVGNVSKALVGGTGDGGVDGGRHPGLRRDMDGERHRSRSGHEQVRRGVDGRARLRQRDIPE